MKKSYQHFWNFHLVCQKAFNKYTFVEKVVSFLVMYFLLKCNIMKHKPINNRTQEQFTCDFTTEKNVTLHVQNKKLSKHHMSSKLIFKNYCAVFFKKNNSASISIRSIIYTSFSIVIYRIYISYTSYIYPIYFLSDSDFIKMRSVILLKALSPNCSKIYISFNGCEGNNFFRRIHQSLKSYSSTFSERRWDGTRAYQNFFPHPCISDVQNDTLK